MVLSPLLGLGLALWELPQDLLGLVFLAWLRLRGRKSTLVHERRRLFIETDGVGVSLGWFVFWCRDLPDGFLDSPGGRTRAHEYGHSIQSRLFGPAYLLLVGLPSVSRVLYSKGLYRRTGQVWPHYYRGWPENHADWLGGVEHPRNRPVGTPERRS